MKYIFSLLFVCFFATMSIAQAPVNLQKGDFYFYWGWNESGYTKSDIRFEGENYNFTLANVIAKDRPTPFDVNIYFNPGLITIPQYNFRIGYFIKDNWDVSLGIDHMKYVLQNGQNASITGNISGSETNYDGIYDNDNIEITPYFLTFEHTDGLNYINLGLSHSNQVLHYKKFQINLKKGIEAGALYPRTNTALLGKERYDEFHLSGYGASTVAGLNFVFFDSFFIQTELKGGYINMPTIRTTKSTADTAAQDFFFYQFNLLFGGIFHFGK